MLQMTITATPMTATRQLVWQVSNSGARQDQTDRNDDGASHHRRKETHDTLGAKGAEERRKHRIKQAGASNAQSKQQGKSSVSPLGAIAA